jgi:hypothetical protein
VDALSVEADYRHHLTSNYENDSLSIFMKQYQAQSTFEVDQNEVNRLAKRATVGEEQSARRSHKLLEPARPARQRIVLPLDPLPVKDAHDRHANMIRKTLICEDEQGVDCATHKAVGECESNRGYMMFTCPRTCGLCSSDGLMCTNFFERKCLEWRDMNQCVEDPDAMRTSCKLACGFCIQDPTFHGKGNTVKTPVLPSGPTIPTAPKGLPYIAQNAWLAGDLPDPMPPKGACSLNDLPNGQLLARVVLTPSVLPGPRVFCGIYTYEKNHPTNVKTTVSTWGKRCHGFLAFSTVDDVTLPAINIEHDGPEEYNNMWQKSRSIWKYIAHNFMNDFDYFLLGGDDMFYIVENLVDYLASDEIVSLKNQGKGMFIGRRFFPPKQQVFNSGGAGYILDRTALKVLQENIDTPKCFPNQVGFWEDVNVANCLRKSADIEPIDTRDSSQRFVNKCQNVRCML